MAKNSKHDLDFLRSRPEDNFWHRSRIMCCLIDGRLRVAPRNTPESHLEWFRREGWLNDENAQDFLEKNIRGFYLPGENKLYAYRGVGFDFDERVLPELLGKIEDLKAVLRLNGETEIHLGPKDSLIFGKDYRKKFAGRIKELQK